VNKGTEEAETESLKTPDSLPENDQDVDANDDDAEVGSGADADDAATEEALKPAAAVEREEPAVSVATAAVRAARVERGTGGDGDADGCA
jgi:hypothetical protein